MSISPNRAFGSQNPPAQSEPDSWTSEVWNIAAVSKGLNDLYVNGQPPQFRLVRQGEQPPLYALKPVTPVELPDCLAPSVLLTQLGTIDPGPVKCITARLPAPFVTPHEPYWTVSEEIIADNEERDLKRLEGTIHLSDGPHTIRLFQVDSVLTNKKTLLVIDIEQIDSTANSDGTAVGHN
jgi:hypothetical protein